MVIICSACETRYTVPDNKILLQGTQVKCKKCQNLLNISNLFIRVLCPNCQASYRIPWEKVPSDKFKTRCLKCQHTFIFSKESKSAPAALEENERVFGSMEDEEEFVQKALQESPRRTNDLSVRAKEPRFSNLDTLLVTRSTKTGLGSDSQVGFKKSRYLMIGLIVLLTGSLFYGFYSLAGWIRLNRQIKSLNIHKKAWELSKDFRVEEGLTPQNYYEKGRQYFLLDDETAYLKAEAYYVKGVTQDLKNPLLLTALAENYAAWGQVHEDAEILEKAYQLVKKALDIDPNLAQGYRVIADLLKYHRQYDEAEEMVKKALELKSDDADSLYVLGSLALIRGENYGTAYEYLKKALKQNPGLVRAYTDLSALLNDLELYDEAIAYARKGLELSPEHLRLKINLALAHKGRGDYIKATEIYQKILELKPSYLQVLTRLGEISNALGNYDSAIRYLAQVTELNPYESEGYANLGDSYAGKGDYKTAVQMYNKAIALNPLFTPYHYKLGDVYVKQRKFQLAKISYQRGLELSRDKFMYYLSMGRMYLEQKLYQLALESYKRAFTLQSRHKEVLEELVKTYEVINETGEASSYRRVLELPGLEKISRAMERGVRCLEKKAYQLAILQFQGALELDKGNAQAYYYLGKAYEASGNQELALSAYISSIKVADMLSPEAKSYVINYVGTHGGDSGVSVLTDLSTNDPSSEIRAKAADALRKIKDPTSVTN